MVSRKKVLKSVATDALPIAAGTGTTILTGNIAAGLGAMGGTKALAKRLISGSAAVYKGIKGVDRSIRSGSAKQSAKQWLMKRVKNPAQLYEDFKSAPEKIAKGIHKAHGVAKAVHETAGIASDVVSIVNPKAGSAIRQYADKGLKIASSVNDTLHHYNDKAKDVRDTVVALKEKNDALGQSGTVNSRAFG